ncbi:hypothetical protein M670_02510 [Schinkia azotoformans MEV2011]|uniref:Uncharacterized protein n=2 Tax=Schinkia azotoformans TaxID=1454 RepID=K6D7C0_SCHAZ|nr:hypothetical protein [Schinkia azotoformans]EKN64194.1 hypothetical protein BAZO_14324 [Schinkia azotoformans LMG 9581]KEF38092.1 hypothetical protein M670_02510 [Schinkia azotoformans MEV2011]MEC1640687.1 hypothetical protein [Schinkia azotoformans]MEC1696653.1 hypothetical protein [Schinkia azotoformans]MEC1715641.1 hypothetical protein [Schinkia azotoformans]
MTYKINGFIDIHSILTNERKLGGVIEASVIRLRTGEEYNNPVITNIDFFGGTFYSLGFIADNGDHMIVNVSDISKITEPTHKKIHEMNNKVYKAEKLSEKNSYLKKLCDLNKGVYIKTFINEVKLLVEDIGVENINKEIDIDFLQKNKKIVKIA